MDEMRQMQKDFLTISKIFNKMYTKLIDKSGPEPNYATKRQKKLC